MASPAGTTTILLPVPLKARLARLRRHARQPYHEIVAQALDLFERRGQRGLDPLVAQHAAGLRRAARRNRIGRVWLFGSRARGEAGPESDVDLLVQALPGANLFHLAGFLADAEDVLGTKVDIADLDGLKPGLRDRILPEAVPV